VRFQADGQLTVGLFALRDERLYAAFLFGGSNRLDLGWQIAVGLAAFAAAAGGLALVTLLICTGLAPPNGSSLVTPFGNARIAL
jgi:hypothetical protein